MIPLLGRNHWWTVYPPFYRSQELFAPAFGLNRRVPTKTTLGTSVGTMVGVSETTYSPLRLPESVTDIPKVVTASSLSWTCWDVCPLTLANTVMVPTRPAGVGETLNDFRNTSE